MNTTIENIIKVNCCGIESGVNCVNCEGSNFVHGNEIGGWLEHPDLNKGRRKHALR